MAMSPRNALVAMLALPAFGCGSASVATTPVGSDSFTTITPEAAPGPPKPKRHDGLPPDVVERAARDFLGLRADGQALSPDELFGEIAGASVLCVGEDPPDPHHHWAQLTVLRELQQRAPARGIELGLGLEMFSAPDQRRLDEYTAKEIGERRLLRTTRYRDNWGHDFALYRPLVEYADSHGIALVALNAPSALTRKVASGGLESLSTDETESLPDLDLDNEAHRRAFDARRTRGPKTGAPADNAYAAEVLAEETVADHVARWVTERRPARQLVVVARMEHCERTAIVGRLRRRDVGKIVSLCPIVESQGALPRTVPEGFDYGFVMVPSGAAAETD